MDKPTPFRQAVNHLKSLGIIKRDNDLLPVLEMASKGALSAYIGGKPPTHIIDKFLNKYGEHVAHFFKDSEEAPKIESKNHHSSTRVEEILERHNAFLQRMLESNLNKLSEVQYMVLAQVQAGQKWDAKNMSKGNVKKYIQMLDELSTLAGESLNAFGVMDIRVPVSKEGKSVP